MLEHAKIRMQIAVGFGDAVQPEPEIGGFPAILTRMAAPRLRMYPPEAMIAEKLHAMVVLDIRNRRRTEVPARIPFALTSGFLLNEAKTQQWQGFLRRLHLEASTPGLPELGRQIALLLAPLFGDRPGERIWKPGGPWRQ